MNQYLSSASNALDPKLQLFQPIEQKYIVENLFTLAIIQKQTRTKIIMDLLNNQISTEEFPSVTDLLKKNLPSVLSTICYNEQDLPFCEEVRNTEIGHLFEHILLEYLCQHKIAKGARRATYIGRTTWNWTRDPLGRFHIKLTCGKKDSDILLLAIENTVSLMKILLENKQQVLFTNNTLSTSTNGYKNGEGRC